MDVNVVGRERVEEQAILEELSGAPNPVRGGDRRWMLAIAGIAALVCMGFAGDLVSPKPTEPVAEIDSAPASSGPSASPLAVKPAIDVEVLRVDGVATGGRVPVRVRAAPNQKVHLSVTIGAAVVGWRDVKAGATGSWEGDVLVFAPRVALPAVLNAGARIGPAAVEAVASFELAGNSTVTVWDAAATVRPHGRTTIVYRASAPLTITEIDARVIDASGREVGMSSTSSRVEDWRPGSAGARLLGLGSVVGAIEVRRHTAGPLTLRITWVDAIAEGSGALEQSLEAP